jgi:outer membrane cobalamin receptor
MNHTTRSLLATVMACGLARQEASAQTGVPDLSAATIEDLMNIQVTTASRAVEGLAAAPARVQVVTAAQIERRGYIGAPQNPRRVSVGFSLRVW